MKLYTLFRHILALGIIAFTLSACNDEASNLPTTYPQSGDVDNTTNTNKNDATTIPELARLEFPKVKGGNNLVIMHRVENFGITYSLEWDCQKKSQRWSCFQMHNGYPDKNIGRTVDTSVEGYPQDPDIPSEYLFESDPYWGTGYDHGHICASEDRQYSVDANRQTFYQSNMQPQWNEFNTGIWLSMEQFLQDSKRINTNSFRDVLYVVKGGTIDKESQIIETTSKGLIVPKYFFMAVLCEKGSSYKAMGFWVENKRDDQSRVLSNYVVSIDYLEEQTGIDFFCNLPDNIERNVEGTSKEQMLKDWNL